MGRQWTTEPSKHTCRRFRYDDRPLGCTFYSIWRHDFRSCPDTWYTRLRDGVSGIEWMQMIVDPEFIISTEATHLEKVSTIYVWLKRQRDNRFFSQNDSKSARFNCGCFACNGPHKWQPVIGGLGVLDIQPIANLVPIVIAEVRNLPSLTLIDHSYHKMARGQGQPHIEALQVMYLQIKTLCQVHKCGSPLQYHSHDWGTGRSIRKQVSIEGSYMVRKPRTNGEHYRH